jgi:hypothetical protein
MKSFCRVFVVLNTLLLVGCSSLPPVEEMKKEASGFKLPKTPVAGKAAVYVVRPSSLGSMVRFNVFIDGEEPEREVGFTRGSQYIHFDLEPGNHKILSKAENWATQNVSAKPGDILFIKQDPSMGFIMARNELVEIPEYEGKYHVKTLEPGTMK